MASAASRGTPGSMAHIPGVKISRTQAPASRSSGVRKMRAEVMLWRGITRSTGKATPR